jgi:hypothetical protein
VGRAFGYHRNEQLTIWSLTLPQVAATLAATLVAHETLGAAGQRLLDDRMLNVVLVLVFATSVLGPVLTERFASRLTTGPPVRFHGLHIESDSEVAAAPHSTTRLIFRRRHKPVS